MGISTNHSCLSILFYVFMLNHRIKVCLIGPLYYLSEFRTTQFSRIETFLCYLEGLSHDDWYFQERHFDSKCCNFKMTKLHKTGDMIWIYCIWYMAIIQHRKYYFNLPNLIFLLWNKQKRYLIVTMFFRERKYDLY